MKIETVAPPTGGGIPNNRLPVLRVTGVRQAQGEPGADWLQRQFEGNDWGNCWRWRVYSYPHFHSNTHEVLGCYRGHARLQLGGPEGPELEMGAGELLLLPAGTGHCALAHSADFAVVGGYPQGREPDLWRGHEAEEELEQARRCSETVPIPLRGPIGGGEVDILGSWRATICKEKKGAR